MNVHQNSGYLSLLLFSILTINVFSQENIQTDRPDQTEGVFVVPKNYLQIESGFNLEKNKIIENSYYLPTNLLKYGLCKNIELQTVIDVFYSEYNNLGILPISFGFKANLAKEKGVVPEISIIGRLQLKDFATNEFRTIENLPMFRFAFQNTISKKITIGYNLGMQWEENSQKTAYIFSISNSYNISAKSSIFAEIFNYTNEENSKQIIDIGFVNQFSKNLIFDCAIGKHINNKELDLYFLVGITTRIKLKK